MDHVQYKANQTAAAYVANNLTEHEQEAFELHMMGCMDCINDVEAWRAIKLHMPEKQAPRTFMSQRRNWWGGWGIAASVAAAAVMAAGGWYARGLQQPDVAGMQAAFFNVPPLTRGDDCTALRYAPDTRSVILRVPRVASDRRVTATDIEGKELKDYSAYAQADGSWVVTFASRALEGRAVQLEARAGGVSESLGCITGESRR